MTYQARAVFYRQLGSMLKAGLPLVNALEHLKGSAGPGGRLFEALYGGVVSGVSLSETAASLASPSFSLFETASLRAGDASGNLPEVLNRLGDYFDFIHRARSRIINGLVYPAFLLHAAIIIPAVPLLFTKGFGAFLAATLPALAILYGLAAAVVFLARKSGPASAFSARFNRVVLAIPVVGSLARKLALLRFLQAFVCLYTAGIEVREAVELAARTMGNAAMEEEMLHSVVLLRNSATISEAFAENPFLPPVLRDMIRVGAVSGKMDETLTSVIGYLQEDVDNTTAKLVSLLPVIVYLLVAVYIGYVIISFYLGYLNQVMTEL